MYKNILMANEPNVFKVNEDLGSIFTKSFNPLLSDNRNESFEDFIKLDNTDYGIYNEISTDTNIPKYTVITSKGNKEKHVTLKENDNSDNAYDSDYNFSEIDDSESDKKNDSNSSENESKMSNINTIYIGSLTIIGLYVFFRYWKN